MRQMLKRQWGQDKNGSASKKDKTAIDHNGNGHIYFKRQNL